MPNIRARGPRPTIRERLIDQIATKPTLTVIEAASILGVSEDSYRRAAATGDLPILKIGHRVVVPTVALLEIIGLGEA